MEELWICHSQVLDVYLRLKRVAKRRAWDQGHDRPSANASCYFLSKLLPGH